MSINDQRSTINDQRVKEIRVEDCWNLVDINSDFEIVVTVD